MASLTIKSAKSKPSEAESDDEDSRSEDESAVAVATDDESDSESEVVPESEETQDVVEKDSKFDAAEKEFKGVEEEAKVMARKKLRAKRDEQEYAREMEKEKELSRNLFVTGPYCLASCLRIATRLVPAAQRDFDPITGSPAKTPRLHGGTLQMKDFKDLKEDGDNYLVKVFVKLSISAEGTI
ncbi:hypothetical protein GGX14DRAFT_408218 [Mycena pura]|uniref:Uncharacterized protein n=1 Tax=Mycena pura TaxID=153505 RepID=A0AAD6XY07_9AGAR|nr:hypothetical protein GGX14DRAFT_408218 [Mycena pura]